MIWGGKGGRLGFTFLFFFWLHHPRPPFLPHHPPPPIFIPPPPSPPIPPSKYPHRILVRKNASASSFVPFYLTRSAFLLRGDKKGFLAGCSRGEKKSGVGNWNFAKTAGEHSERSDEGFWRRMPMGLGFHVFFWSGVGRAKAMVLGLLTRFSGCENGKIFLFFFKKEKIKIKRKRTGYPNGAHRCKKTGNSPLPQFSAHIHTFPTLSRNVNRQTQPYTRPGNFQPGENSTANLDHELDREKNKIGRWVQSGADKKIDHVPQGEIKKNGRK